MVTLPYFDGLCKSEGGLSDRITMSYTTGPQGARKCSELCTNNQPRVCTAFSFNQQTKACELFGGDEPYTYGNNAAYTWCYIRGLAGIRCFVRIHYSSLDILFIIGE